MTWTRTSMSPLAAVSLGMLVSGCPDVTGEQAEVAKAAVEQGFAAANPAGRTGVEVLGKTVWLEAPMFDKSCLELSLIHI